MIVHLKLEAIRKIRNTPYKKGDILEMSNNLLDTQSSVMYYSLNKNWKIIEIKIIKNEKKS